MIHIQTGIRRWRQPMHCGAAVSLLLRFLTSDWQPDMTLGTDGAGRQERSPAGQREQRVKFRIVHRRAAVLLAFLALLIGLPVTASASDAAMSSGWIRVGNLSANTSAVDVYVYSSGDSSAQFMVPDVSYGTVSAF